MNEIPGIPKPYSTQILDLFLNLPPDTEVILFGSRAKGTFREGSDIDIALRGALVSEDHRRFVANEFESLLLPWKLDLILYNSISEPALREHIERAGRRLEVVERR